MVRRLGGDMAQSSPPVAAPSAGDQIIPVKNPKALAAYYCAIFGLIPCVSAILGPVSLVLGILGLRAVNRNPALPGKAHAWIGIILGGLETAGCLAVVVSIL